MGRLVLSHPFPYSILVTLLGIRIEVRSLHLVKADTPILVTVFGIKVRLQPKSKVSLSVSMIALQSLRES